MKTKEIGIIKEDNNEIENIFSINKKLNYFSFIDKISYIINDKYYSPLYISDKNFLMHKSISFEDFNNEFEIQKDGRLKCKNNEIINSQKGVILDLFKNFTLKLLEGKNIVGVSLPVRIFHPRSFSDRITDLFVGFPYFLKYCESMDSFEKLKYIATAIVSGLVNIINQWKPFNPILGETYQGSFSDGTKIYVEHISHHPPISSILIENKIFVLTYTVIINGKIQVNSIKAFNEGILKIKFKKTNEKFKAIIPVLNLDGSILGSRLISFDGVLAVWNKTHKILINMSSHTNKGFFSYFNKGQTDIFKGSLYEYNKEEHDKLMKDSNIKFYDKIFKLLDIKDNIKTLDEINGIWYKNIFFNKTEYWNFENDYDLLRVKIHEDDPLPSDMRFREDLISVYYNNIDAAQYWKVIMEEQQRKDKRTRNLEKKK